MRALRLPAVLLACLLLASACASSDDEPAEPTVAQSAEPETSPTTPEAPATSPTSPSAPETSAAAQTLEDRLLETGAVPGLNAQWRWQDGETGPAGAEPFGVCAKVDLLSIGATEVVERTYFPPDDSDDHAAQQVAEFPDEATAARAWAVQEAWRKRCGTSMSSSGAPVARAMVPVSVPTGEGRWYLVTSQPVGEETGRFDAIGMARNGTLMTVLVMSNSGQDYNYPVGKEPMVAMVKAAAAALG